MSSETAAAQPSAPPLVRHRACSRWEIPRGGMRLVTVAGIELGIFEVNGTFRAYRNACPHAGAPVCTGKITGTTLPGEVYSYGWGRIGEILRCPWHGWEFDLKNGEHLADCRTRLRQYPLTSIDDDIFVDL